MTLKGGQNKEDKGVDEQIHYDSSHNQINLDPYEHDKYDRVSQ